ncbi:MAG TPA: LLM class F420-dependent oxidoreductase, partial [Actinomycetes bacterium]|nr:LLM class F420-dependent oxidoreductase [Actinomycetes bacterium]
GAGTTAGEQLELVREAERLGYDSAWVAEAYGSDAATVLAWLAAQTGRIHLGSAVFQMPARSPAMTAMTAATLDQLSGGRFRLGLGLSGPQVAEGWHGQRYDRPLQRTRDYLAVVRLALARKRVVYQGETLQLPLPDGPGKALKLTIGPVQQRLPIYLAAMGPRNTALAAELADGLLGYLYAPDHGAEVRAQLRAGAARAGRDLDGFDVAPTVQVRIGEDLQAARDTMRPLLALYVGGMGSRQQNFYNDLVRRYGFERAAAEVQEHYLEGRREAAAAALPEELIDAVTLCGPAGRVRERLAAYREAGVGTLIAAPQAPSHPQRLAQLRTLAELAG